MIITIAGEKHFSSKIAESSLLKNCDIYLFDTLFSEEVSHIKISKESSMETLFTQMLLSLKANQNVLLVNDFSLQEEDISREILKKRYLFQGDRYIFVSFFLKNQLKMLLNSERKTNFVSYQESKIILESYL